MKAEIMGEHKDHFSERFFGNGFLFPKTAKVGKE